MVKNLLHALKARLSAYTEVCSELAVIRDGNCASPAQTRMQARDMVKKYPSDLAGTFLDELEQFILICEQRSLFLCGRHAEASN